MDAGHGSTGLLHGVGSAPFPTPSFHAVAPELGNNASLPHLPLHFFQFLLFFFFSFYLLLVIFYAGGFYGGGVGIAYSVHQYGVAQQPCDCVVDPHRYIHFCRAFFRAAHFDAWAA